MGRKKRKQIKPWCWYCNREFDDEKILVQHQKAKHFKCQFCYKKLDTGPGLSIHCTQVHREKVDKIPNSLPERCSTVIAIYGMNGIPEADLIKHEAEKLGLETEEVADPKQARYDIFPPVPSQPPPGLTGFMGAQVPSMPFVPPPPPISSMVQPPPPPIEPSLLNKPVKTIPRPAPGANGLPVELIHPDEDLPLEELRLTQSPKYKFVADLITTRNLHSTATPAPLPPPMPCSAIPMAPPVQPAGLPIMPPMLGVGAPPIIPGAVPPWTGHGPPMRF